MSWVGLRLFSDTIPLPARKKAAIDLDRKVLADLAINDKAAFKAVVDQVQAAQA